MASKFNDFNDIGQKVKAKWVSVKLETVPTLGR